MATTCETSTPLVRCVSHTEPRYGVVLKELGCRKEAREAQLTSISLQPLFWGAWSELANLCDNREMVSTTHTPTFLQPPTLAWCVLPQSLSWCVDLLVCPPSVVQSQSALPLAEGLLPGDCLSGTLAGGGCSRLLHQPQSCRVWLLLLHHLTTSSGQLQQERWPPHCVCVIPIYPCCCVGVCWCVCRL